jgi:hypothetical protein
MGRFIAIEKLSPSRDQTGSSPPSVDTRVFSLGPGKLLDIDFVSTRFVRNRGDESTVRRECRPDFVKLRLSERAISPSSAETSRISPRVSGLGLVVEDKEQELRRS